MALRDQMLAGEPIIGVYGPLPGLTRAAVVAAVTKLAANAPYGRLTWNYHQVNRQWNPHRSRLAEWCRTLVAPSIPATSNNVIQRALQQYRHVNAQAPLRFVVAGNYLVEVADHALGDGRAFVDRFAAVARLVAGREVDFTILHAPPTSRPTARAVRNTLWPPRRETMALWKTLLRSPASLANKLPSQQHIPWQPSPAVQYAYLPPAVHHALRSSVKSGRQPATMASAYAVLLRRALRVAQVPLSPSQTVIFDLRRYLPPGSGPVTGNFIAGPQLSGDALDDPRQLSTILQHWIRTGYPLAAVVMGIARHRLTTALPKTTAPQSPHANLVFSSLTMEPELPSVSKNGDAAHGIYALCSPSTDPETITIVVTSANDALHITATFHDNVFSSQAIGDALEWATADPMGLLASRGTRR